MKTTRITQMLLKALFFAVVPALFLLVMYMLNGVLPCQKDNQFSVRENVLGPLTQPLPEFANRD
ncbi:hypothetical protein KFE98_08295 [bacterium SCSIO 12741]|nr:hypothetical protein KFE98_08295 [bacterium SCSIO 12741]